MGIDPSSIEADASRRQEERAVDPTRSELQRRTTIVEGDRGPSAEVGDVVSGSDGKRLGTICDVSGGYFEIESSDGRPFWMSCVYIASSADGNVRLTVPANQAEEEHRLNQPGLETLDRGLTGTGTREQTELDALATRERMERELLEQRGTIDTDVRSGASAQG